MDESRGVVDVDGSMQGLEFLGLQDEVDVPSTGVPVEGPSRDGTYRRVQAAEGADHAHVQGHSED
jgi:hypothetical protein